jgi:hypothetical protein
VSTFLSHSLVVLGDYEKARDILKSALIYCDTVQADLLKPYVLSIYGYASAKMGDIRRGKKYCFQAVQLAEQSGLSLRMSLFKRWYAEVLIMDGKRQDALKILNSITTKDIGIASPDMMNDLEIMRKSCEASLLLWELRKKKKRPNNR